MKRFGIGLPALCVKVVIDHPVLDVDGTGTMRIARSVETCSRSAARNWNHQNGHARAMPIANPAAAPGAPATAAPEAPPHSVATAVGNRNRRLRRAAASARNPTVAPVITPTAAHAHDSALTTRRADPQ
jgi:hypothetical protein